MFKKIALKKTADQTEVFMEVDQALQVEGIVHVGMIGVELDETVSRRQGLHGFLDTEPLALGFPARSGPVELVAAVNGGLRECRECGSRFRRVIARMTENLDRIER